MCLSENVFSVVEVGALYTPPQTWQTLSLLSSHCAQGHCNAGTGLGLLVPLKTNCNATGRSSQSTNSPGQILL